MNALQFTAPVRLWDHGQRVEVGSVHQALQFLRQWPESRQGPVFRSASRSCEAAWQGQVSADEARQSLASFADITGILDRDDRIASA